MNYEALDEALEYIDQTDEISNESAKDILIGGLKSLGKIAAGIAIAIIGFITLIAIAVNVENSKEKRIENAINDPKAQNQLKKIFKFISDAMKKDSSFKKFTKYFNWLQYNINHYRAYKSKETLELVLNIAEIKTDELFKDIYNVSMKEYNNFEKIPLSDDAIECKNAPKFTEYIKDIDKTCKDFYAPIKSKVSSKANTRLEVSVEDEMLKDFYTTYSKECSDGAPMNITLFIDIDFSKIKRTKSLDI